MNAYQTWIDQHYPTRKAATCKCAEATEAMCEEFPELARVRGHYDCWAWGMREHWWCVTPDGAIVDPTARQFPSEGSCQYIAFNESGPEPTGKCPNCGGYCYDNDTCCSDAYSREYVAFVNRGRIIAEELGR